MRKISEDDFSNLRDTSILAAPGAVDDLIDNRQNRKWGAESARNAPRGLFGKSDWITDHSNSVKA